MNEEKQENESILSMPNKKMMSWYISKRIQDVPYRNSEFSEDLFKATEDRFSEFRIVERLKNAGVSENFLREFKINVHIDFLYCISYYIRRLCKCENVIPQASASSFRSKKININAEWLALIVLRGDEPKVRNAFITTVGHEVSHQLHDIPFYNRRFKQMAGLSWIEEVYNDFFGASLLPEASTSDITDAYQFKLEMLGEKTKKSKANKRKTCPLHCLLAIFYRGTSLLDSHPTWVKRIEYLETGQFNKNLMNQIACDAFYGTIESRKDIVLRNKSSEEGDK